MRSIIFALAILVGSTVTAQQASYTYIPQPPPYSGYYYYVQPLIALNTPKIGTVFQVQIPLPKYGSHCTTSFWLLTGTSNPHIDLGRLGIPGVLYSSAEIAWPSYGFGPYGGTFGFPIPHTAELIGASFWQQVFWATGCGGYGGNTRLAGSLSRGGHGVIGL